MSNPNTNLNQLQILIVEDDPYIQKIINHSLSKEYGVTLFDDGLAGLTYLQEGNLPDLIVLDLNIPSVSGMDFIAQVKASGFFSAIPIIILSATESSETRIKCLEAGADDFVVKPFNPRELEARVKIILKRAGKMLLVN